MHFSNIATAFTFIVAATALPNPNGATGSTPTCGNTIANKCCDDVKQEGVLGILQNVGLNCNDLILGSTCGGSQKAACCSDKNTGLVVLDICQLAAL